MVLWDHVTTSNHYTFLTPVLMVPTLASWGLEGLLPIILLDLLFTWSREVKRQTKTITLPLPLYPWPQTWQNCNLPWLPFIYERYTQGKSTRKLNCSAYEKYEYGHLGRQINSFKEVLKVEQIFQKNKVVTGKTPFFVIGPFCSRHSICLNIGFWQSSFEWKWCVFNLSGFN